MDALELCDESSAVTIARGRFTPACTAMGHANLPTVIRALDLMAGELATARANNQPHAGYRSRFKLLRARRRRLEMAAQLRREQIGQAHTIRV